MTLNNFTDGEVLTAAKLDDNLNSVYSLAGVSLIRQIQDRSVTFSKGSFDWWGDAATSVSGRNASVTALSGVSFSTNKWITSTSITNTLGSYGTSGSNNSYGSFAVLFTGTLTQVVVRAGGSGTKNIGVYKNGVLSQTFTSTAMTVNTQSTFNLSPTISVVPGDVIMLRNDTDATAVFYTTSSTYTTNPYVSSTGVSGGYSLTDNTGSNTTITTTFTNYDIKMAIPASTFSATVSSARGVPHISEWETGADIQYKLTNASEDSGWLTCANTPQASSFTAFTSQPTFLTVRLIPKSSSPTAGYPGIYGFVVRAE